MKESSPLCRDAADPAMKDARTLPVGLLVLTAALALPEPGGAARAPDADQVLPATTRESDGSLSGRDVLSRFGPRMARIVDFHGIAEHRSDLDAAVGDLLRSLAKQGHQLTAGPGDGRIFTGSQWCEIGPRAKVYHLAAPKKDLWVDILVFPSADDLAKRWPTFRRSIPHPNSGSTGPNRALIYNHAEAGNSVAIALFCGGNQVVNIGRRLSVAVPNRPDETTISPGEQERIWRTLDKELSTVCDVTWATVRHLACEEDLAWIPSPAAEQQLTADERVWGFLHLWHEVKYNFAFFDHVPELSWDRTRLRYLPLVKRDQSNEEYYRLLQRCMALLRDGHTQVFLSEPQDHPLVRATMVDGKVLIADVAAAPDPGQAPLKPGLEITHVAGQPVAEVLAQEVYPYVSASTPQDRDRRACRQLLAGQAGTLVTLTVSDLDAATREVALRRVDRRRIPWFAGRQDLVECRDLADGIVYVALNSFGSDRVAKEFDGIFDRIRRAKGLVLDVRQNGGGSSSNGYAIIGRLINEPLTGSVWKTRQYMPAYRAWGKKEEWYKGEPSQVRPRGSAPYLGPVVVLIGPGTVSAAEDFLIPLRTGNRATLIGEKTAGTTGQPLMVDLPGARQARICAKRDSYPDGTEFVGVGVIPDIEVKPTREDIALGRDAALAKAIEVLRSRSISQPPSAPARP